MELTKEILEINGFTDNHPERVLGKFYCSGKDYRIHVEGAYIPGTNTLGWSVGAWKEINGRISKRANASVIQTIEDLQAVINLCQIDLLIYPDEISSNK